MEQAKLIITASNVRPGQPVHRKLPVDPKTLIHKQLLEGPFWQRIPAYSRVSEKQFFDHRWQARNSITRLSKLLAVLQAMVPQRFYDDVAMGFRHSPMSLRISPYLLSLIDWTAPQRDPLRRQFIPLGSQLRPDHPELTLDSLAEQADSPVPGLTHRYRDKALFLALDTCPVYCRFCTRSYAVGIDTDKVEKMSLKAREERWKAIFRYIGERPEVEDIVISGGDTYQLKPRQITLIGETLLDLDNVRRIRFATKGPAVMPQKLLSDTEWLDALTSVVELGRRRHKEVVVHTHFNHPNEITDITRQAMNVFFERGITVRSQSVLQRGVNDNIATMQLLVKRLGYCNVQPYYVYMHDLVKGVEDLRTTLQTGLDIERHVRGITAGFNTPTFVVDMLGGGGKRAVHSHDHYDCETGISVYSAPSVKSGYFLYFDPIDRLTPSVQARWQRARDRKRMIDDALDAANVRRATTARASAVRAEGNAALDSAASSKTTPG
ncbi:MAG: KamA family radical SAM protein [Proteobacteria bacterium]|nr:KamA family radical SAM protein [Pseudomonadota bacterium]